jgi:hypothetical protein
MTTVSPQAKKILGLVVVVFLLFFVISRPNESANIVRDLLNMLQEGAEALITFLQSLFA